MSFQQTDLNIAIYIYIYIYIFAESYSSCLNKMYKAVHQTDSQEEGVNETERQTTALPSLLMMESENCPFNNDCAIVTEVKFKENQIALIKSEITVVRRKEDEMLAILHKLEQRVSFLVTSVESKKHAHLLFAYTILTMQ